MNCQKVADFLRKASKATYADARALKSDSLRPGSKDYHFEADEFVYHDTYFGNRRFVGEEIVYESKTPIWGANYFGAVIDDRVSEKEVFDFLRQALIQDVEGGVPVRGPERYSDGGRDYRFLLDGTLSLFSGVEEIVIGGIVVYRCFVHGGEIR